MSGIRKIAHRTVMGGLIALALMSTGPGSLALAGEDGALVEAESPQAGDLITINARRLPLERVLEYISRASGAVNIKFNIPDADREEEVRRQFVTVELENVGWRTALEYVAQKYGFTLNYEREREGIILLETPPTITYTVRDDEQMMLRDAILLIAKDVPNLIISPEVLQRQDLVYFSFKNKPWKDALQALLRQYRYVLIEEDDGTYRVTSRQDEQLEMRTEVIRLQYITAEGAHFTPQITMNNTFYGRSGQANSAAGSQTQQTLLTTLQALSTNQGDARGVVQRDASLNAFIIRDTPTVINEMREIIRTIDRAPKQVKIACQMLRTSTNPRTLLGVSWDQANGDFAGARLGITGDTSWNTLFPFTPGMNPVSILRGIGANMLRPIDNNGMSFTNNTDPTTDTHAGYYNGSNIKTASLSTNFLMQAVKQDTNAKLIQAPHVVVLDHQEAAVQVGETLRYVNITTTYDDTGNIQETSFDEQELDTGVQMLVVPHVCGDTENVIVEVIPTTTDFDEADWDTFNANGETYQIPRRVRTKTIVTQMMIRNGDTGIIGGLMSDSKSQSVNKIPLLGDIPVIGWMFKHKNKSQVKETLYVLISPTILSPSQDSQFQEQLNQQYDIAEGLLTSSVLEDGVVTAK